MKAGVSNMTATDSNSTGELSVRVSRFIRAPRERVFEAWLKPEIRRKWWRTSRGDGPTACEIDARVGGRYLLKQIGGGCEAAPEQDDDKEWIMQGEFLEIDPPSRLVFTWNVNHTEEPVVDQRVTIEFREAEGGTEVEITHQGIHSTGMLDGTQGGWSKLLETLASVMEQS